MNLFALNDGETFYDITKHIEVPSYKVNLMPMYEDWVDGNKKTHRHKFRDKLMGSFTVHFGQVSEFEKFVQNVEAMRRQDQTIPVEAYANNMRSGGENDPVYSRDVYLTWEPENDLPYYGIKQVSGYVITIEEP